MGKRCVRDRLRRVEAHLEGDEEPPEIRVVWADEDDSPPAPGEVVIQLTWGNEDGRMVPGQEAEEDEDAEP